MRRFSLATKSGPEKEMREENIRIQALSLNFTDEQCVQICNGSRIQLRLPDLTRVVASTAPASPSALPRREAAFRSHHAQTHTTRLRFLCVAVGIASVVQIILDRA